MENYATRIELKVGLFVGLGILVILISIFLLSADNSLFTRYLEYRTHLKEVQGLFPGSVVSLSGLKIGNVKSIEFIDQDNTLELVLNIKREHGHRLNEGVVAETRTQGALGDKFIYLIPGPDGTKPLAPGSLIPSSETDYLKLLTSREDGAARAIDLIKELHILVQSINSQGQAVSLLKNMNDMTTKAKVALGELSTLAKSIEGEIPKNQKLKSALVSLANVMEKIDRGQGTLGQLINDPTVHRNLKSLLGGSPRSRYMKDLIRETLQKSDSQ